jgi:hypothetical protein
VLADFDRWLAAALTDEAHGRTAAELLELAEDLDEDQRRMLLAMLAKVKDGERYARPVGGPPPQVRPRR